VSRLVAALYDPLVARDGRLRAARADLLAGAEGRVLEIGAGTGLNLPHYPPGLDVTFTEPDPHMAKRLDGAVVAARAEELPFRDEAFDTVVSTLVLCSVGDLDRALREVRRVLRPGGRLLFLEHVRGPDGSRLARWQDRLAPVWRAVADGCNCNRDTVRAVRAVFDSVEARELDLRPPLTRPVVAGAALS
jgi:SAM-dependent methyltransferase